jgi:hypothetical protein
MLPFVLDPQRLPAIKTLMVRRRECAVSKDEGKHAVSA